MSGSGAIPSTILTAQMQSSEQAGCCVAGRGALLFPQTCSLRVAASSIQRVGTATSGFVWCRVWVVAARLLYPLPFYPSDEQVMPRAGEGLAVQGAEFPWPALL